jgi:hypothetical protein
VLKTSTGGKSIGRVRKGRAWRAVIKVARSIGGRGDPGSWTLAYCIGEEWRKQEGNLLPHPWAYWRAEALAFWAVFVSEGIFAIWVKGSFLYVQQPLEVECSENIGQLRSLNVPNTRVFVLGVVPSIKSRRGKL